MTWSRRENCIFPLDVALSEEERTSCEDCFDLSLLSFAASCSEGLRQSLISLEGSYDV